MNTIEDCPANKKGLLLRPGVWDSPAPDTQRQAHVIPSDFKQHDLWQLLEEIDTTAMNLPFIQYQDDEDKRTIRNRLPLYISAVEQHRGNAADYYSAQLLDTMKQQWDNVQARLDQIERTPAQAHEIDRELDKVAERLATWPNIFILKGSAVAKAIEVFEEVQGKWASRIESLEKQLEAKEQELADKEVRHQELREEIDAEIAALYAKLDINENLIYEQKEKIASQTVEHSEKFDEAQKERRETYQKWIEDQSTEIEEESDVLLSALGEKLAEGDSQLQGIKALHESVEKVAHGATAVFLARDYNTASKRDYLAGMIFMGLGVFLLVIAGFVLFNSFSTVTPDTSITWQWTALKVSATLLITAGATFAFKFSQNFLNSASRTKRSDLELRAIHPFLATLDNKELSDATKVEFINRSFGQPEAPGSSNSKEGSTDQEKNMYKELFELFLDWAKQNRG